MIIKLFNILFILTFPFIFIGLINRTKAFWAGRKGAPVLQPFYDFRRLLQKGAVYSTTSTYVMRIFPVVTYSSILFAGLLVPVISHQSVIDFNLNIILFAYILAAGKFLLVIGALDTGSSFEGMGASREVTFSALMEPAFFIVLACFAALTGHYSFDDIFILLKNNDIFTNMIVFMSILVLFIMILTEGSRVPVDDPCTHLELTMIHEVMVLDNSGPDLALINHGTAMKMTLFGLLIANLILPVNISAFLSLIGLILILSALALLIGTIESIYARLRLIHVPQFIFIGISISFIIVASTLISLSGGIK